MIYNGHGGERPILPSIKRINRLVTVPSFALFFLEQKQQQQLCKGSRRSSAESMMRQRGLPVRDVGW